MRNLTKLILAVCLLCAAAVSYAAVPHLINYQGKLTNQAGLPLEGVYQITFRIYDAEAAGSLLWEETQNVIVQKGVFNTMLGSSVDLDIPFDQPYFLEIKVGDEVMTPRQKITSAGYAIRAELADDVLSLPAGIIVMWNGSVASIPEGWALCDGTNGTPDLRDRFVVGAGTTYTSGATGGEAVHTLTIAEIPAHTHIVSTCSSLAAGSAQYVIESSVGGSRTVTSSSTGGNQPHNNLPPYYALCFIMKTQ